MFRRFEESWKDVGRETFKDYYGDWHVYTGRIAQSPAMMSDELEAVADRVTDVPN